MKQKNESQQWDDLLDQAFGTERTADPGFSAPVQGTPQSAPQISVPKARPFYRRRRFWITVAAAAVLLSAAICFFADRSEREQPILPDYNTMPTPEDTTLQDGLALCKTALAQWQTLETYHINLSYLRYGDTEGGGYSSAEFWRAGEDFLYTAVSPTLNDGMVMGILQQNGILYTATVSNNAGPYSHGWETSDSEELQEFFLIPWPISFDWENSEIAGHSTVTYDGLFSSVSFAVLQSSDAFAPVTPYFVHCTFNSSQELDSVTVILTTPGKGSQTRSTVITYRMGSESTSEIEMKVGTALRMPLTPPKLTAPADVEPE